LSCILFENVFLIELNWLDCLNLNIWKPTSAKAGAKLPVVAYIHGGGFFFGVRI
jgi:carboxylesterase type B